jgi:hypothetical protein
VNPAVEVGELLARASSRVEVRPGDARTGSIFERIEVDGDRYFVKRLSPSSDWVMRITGDHVHRPYLVWQAGIMGRAPACIDHTVVAMDIDGEGDEAVLTIVMRDVTAHLIAEGDSVVGLAQHQSLVENLAAFSAAFWGFRDDLGLSTMEQRVRYFAPDHMTAELCSRDVPAPIAAADAGWRALAPRSAVLAGVARAVHDQPQLVTAPLATTPTTFLHGDWKMGNLGSHPDGRTILLDWAYPGAGPVCWDLCWYLALNRARLPESKEATSERFRAALERHGVATADWWEAQFDLCVIAIMATFGWEKALGDDAELRWWEAHVAAAARRRGLVLPLRPW